jgi:ribosomal protein L11 methyltransferase
LNWLAVRALPESGERDTVLRVLFALGSQGVHEDGERLVTHFPSGVSQSSVSSAFRDAGVVGRVEFESIPPIDWSERWKDQVKSQDIGLLHVCPPWLAREAPEAAVVVTIEPGMAFGTGEHASTRGALQLLQKHLRVGDRVVDLGAGSAVLAIAAAKLGARTVAAIESDADAMANATDNVERNGVESTVIVLEGDAVGMLPLVSPADLVLANIISSVLLALLPAIRAALAPGGRVILSGVMSAERENFVSAVQGSGWTVADEYHEGSWCSLAILAR